MRLLPLSVIAACAVVLPLAAAQAANPIAGKKVFDANCAACHGTDGIAVVPQTPNFARGERLEKPDAQLLTTVRNGLNVMPAWKGMISEADMADALAYIRTLRR